MSRAGRVLAFVALLSAGPAGAAPPCDRGGTGDICASGSPWYDFTRIRSQPRGQSAPATTMILHREQDFSVEIESNGAKGRTGKIIVIDGRAMLMKDVPHKKGYEIDALDGPVLTTQIIVTLLDQAFPSGPASVRTRERVSVAQKTRAIRIATASASGRFEAPWTLSGTVERTGGRITYDLQFAARTGADPYTFDAVGYWVKEPRPVAVDERMPLDGWTVHWLGPMTTSSSQGTTIDYAAQPASQGWKDVAALRKWIADEPARRASRRVPVDATNPGRMESISYEASEVDKTGARKLLGTGVREYRPGIDVVAEEAGPRATSKTLAIGHGLSLSMDVYREAKLSGFGLVLERDGADCFSWEWFNREAGDTFIKLRGSGRLKVSVTEGGGTTELTAVEFLDDVVLRCEDKSNGTRHEARIGKGSVFKLRP